MYVYIYMVNNAKYETAYILPPTYGSFCLPLCYIMVGSGESRNYSELQKEIGLVHIIGKSQHKV